ncbi:PHP domain-containing protein [Dehalococcoidia bacterium]|nr:PHP domain-containing protein [Dehalococcoidia bacterium]
MVELDLHLHTTQSDGRLTPSELVSFVAKRGLKVIAITDHDITDGLESAWAAASSFPQLTIIPGIELSTDIPGNEIHILGYHIDYKNPEFQSVLERFRRSRVHRAEEMVQRLATLGLPVDWARVKELAGHGAIGRPHIAQAMVEKGYVAQPQDSFKEYLGRNGLAYVEREKQTPEEAVKMVVGVGGVPVLAHPAYLDDLDAVIESLKIAGLQGMEVHYAEYDKATRQQLSDVASRHNLIPCGGSDYHAFGTPGEHLPGEMGPPIEVAEQIYALARRTA